MEKFTIFGTSFFKAGAKDATTLAAKDLTETEAKQTVKNLAKNDLKDVLKNDAKNFVEKDTTTVGKKISNKEANLVETDAMAVENNLKKIDINDGEIAKNSKIVDFMKKNPGKTLGAATVAVFGAVVVGVAIKSYEDNVDKVLNIVSMVPGNNSSDVIITYSPNAKFVKNDSTQILNTNMIPPHVNDTFNIIDIISDTKIKINIPNIMVYATSGTIKLKTTMENRLAKSAEDNAQAVVSTAGSVVSGTASGIFGGVSQVLGPYLIYVEGCCTCLCCLILLGIAWKIYQMYQSD